jgi:hypothetical protein
MSVNVRWDKRLQRAALPHVPRLPGGRAPGTLAHVPLSKPADNYATDEHGLSLLVTARMSALGREYLALAYRYFSLNPRLPPSKQGFRTAGTLPELVFLGALLAHGYTPGQHPQGFVFQQALLGGRVPGGSLTDFTIFNSSRPVAVYVDSIYHSLRNPFGAGAKISQDKILREQVLSRTFIKAVVAVNIEADGFPLENGPDMLIDLEVRGALAA